jgi:CheY-specific phosphatase CheX
MSASPIAIEAFAVMERHLAEATVELFGAYGIGVRHSRSSTEDAPSSIDASVAAIIGYAGESVRGALVMVTSKPVVESWLLALGGPGITGDVCDTLGEFSNMLLGRLKARLSPVGFPILLSTPIAAFGTGFRMARASGPSTWLTFDGPGWSLNVRIDATFDEGFVLRPLEDRGTAVEAGDLMMF